VGHFENWLHLCEINEGRMRKVEGDERKFFVMIAMIHSSEQQRTRKIDREKKRKKDVTYLQLKNQVLIVQDTKAYYVICAI